MAPDEKLAARRERYLCLVLLPSRQQCNRPFENMEDARTLKGLHLQPDFEGIISGVLYLIDRSENFR